jgi:WD40 repeat protein
VKGAEAIAGWEAKGVVRVAVGTVSGEIHLFEVGKKAPLRIMKAKTQVIHLALSPIGKSLASVSKDGSVLIWILP